MESNKLSPDQMEKAKACKSPEELMKLVSEEGIELTEDQLDAISGGKVWYDFSCSDNECPYFNCGTYC